MGRFAVVGMALPLALYLAGSVPGVIFTGWLILATFLLCPPYVLFMATAACEPFDRCTLETLALVVLLNVILYGLLGFVWGASRRPKR